MAKKLDHIIVIDVEATCWESSPPPGQQSEIIEIGVCPLEVASGRRLGRQSILVRPERSSVSEFCTRLTTLTQEQVAGGISFDEACSLLRRQYLVKERIWASYGDYDRRQFERQCQAYSLPYPFGSRHLNIKSLLAIIHALPLEVGMAEALQLSGLPLEGVHHRGGDDAWNIAAILAAILRRARGSLVP
jgi:inhibitor of KinA sporulation pathway (predicted exonuclease)